MKRLLLAALLIVSASAAWAADPAPATPAAPVAPVAKAPEPTKAAETAPVAAVPQTDPCAQILSACAGAGYAGSIPGKELGKDCVEPLLAGKPVAGVTFKFTDETLKACANKGKEAPVKEEPKKEIAPDVKAEASPTAPAATTSTTAQASPEAPAATTTTTAAAPATNTAPEKK